MEPQTITEVIVEVQWFAATELPGEFAEWDF